jgi:hypothetical protein
MSEVSLRPISVRSLFLTVALVAFLSTSTPVALAQSQTYPPEPGSWVNDYRIYLSPSDQSNNIGCDNFNEEFFAVATARRAGYIDVGRSLTSRGYTVRIGQGTPSQKVADSNAFDPRYHIALHSNAIGSANCGSSRGGTEAYNYTGNVSGSFLAQEILDYLAPLSPGSPDRRVHRTDFLELNATIADAVYVESGFHTNAADAQWLRQYSSWAWNIGRAVDVRLGYP